MCDMHSPCSQVMLLIDIPEGCIAESHPTVRTSKLLSGKTDTRSISSHLLMISFTKHFVSRVEFERRAYNLLDCNTLAPEIRNARALGSKASTPEDENGEATSGNVEAGSGETGDDEVGVNSAKPVEKSEYERSREANIAKNEQLIHELQEKFGWGDEEDNASERKKERKKGKQKDKKKATQEQRASARLREGVTLPDKSLSLSAPAAISEKETNNGGLDAVSQRIEDVMPVASTGDIDTINPYLQMKPMSGSLTPLPLRTPLHFLDPLWTPLQFLNSLRPVTHPPRMSSPA